MNKKQKISKAEKDLFGKHRLCYIVATFFIALGMFLMLNLFVSILHREGLFAKVQACCGLLFTEYAFLAIVIISFLQAAVSAKQK